MIADKKYNIVLIEDDIEDAFLLEELLREDTEFLYKIETYHTLNDFLKNDLKNTDVVLSDMNLPDSTGLETVKNVLKKIPDKPLIVLTGNNDINIANQSIDIGSQDFLVKGKFGNQQLIKAIKFAIGRKAVKDELRNNKNLLQNVFNSSPINQVLVNDKMIITDINQSATLLFQQIRDQLLGQNFLELVKSFTRGFDESIAKLFAFLEDSMKSNKFLPETQLELPFSKTKDFEKGMFIITAKNINNHTSKSLLIGLNEITELEYAKQKAEQANAYKNNFIANMSHEIRTPMNGVIGFSELLKENNLTAEKKKKFLDIIINNGQQLLELIDDIIDVAKIESNDLQIKKSEVNIGNAMAELYTMFDSLKANKNKAHLNLEVIFPPEHENLKIITDSNRIKQVMDNLLSNSLKFTVAGYIKFGFYVETDFVEFFVEDSGRGIPKNKLKEVFERFKQVRYEDSVQLGGTGLGLAISDGIVKALGGEMKVESQEGRGTKFSFTIPNISDETQKKQKASKNKDLKELLKGKKILIADDEEFIQYYFKEVFKNTECHLEFANNGLEAVKTYRSSSFDLILMDLRMPEMNGFKAIKKIFELNPKAKIIAQTAYAMPDEHIKCMELGCRDYITKPIIKKALFEAIIKALN